MDTPKGLALTRRDDERTDLILPTGQVIRLWCRRGAGNQTKITIDAPAAVRILRAECQQPRDAA